MLVILSGKIMQRESLIYDKNRNAPGSILLGQKLERKGYFSPRTKEKFDSSCDVELYDDDRV